MTRSNSPIPRTALQDDYAFKAVDDFDTRMYILPHLRDPEKLAALIDEHRDNPVYRGTTPGRGAEMNSEPLRRLLDRLRATPQAGKHTILETRPWEEYTIGILPGPRGGTVELTDENYPTRGQAEHAIFLKRLTAFLKLYDIEMPKGDTSNTATERGA
ncbi:hypothetical protein [Aminobacter niigataensis]|uniref:hypothetical protein n=1 Tax=Aminobacter niigataensis TaxID=83265 RepID=UPI002283BA51|nr:hypothetical protein [Aminobacter niigataensis]CAI2936820.1 conserved protein of unknown function [Aminobacter niigataensis]